MQNRIQEDGEFAMTPVEEDPSILLEQLLKLVTDDNIHDEVDTGAPVGKEVW